MAEAVGYCPETPHLLESLLRARPPDISKPLSAGGNWRSISWRKEQPASHKQCRHCARCGVASSLPQGSPPLPSLLPSLSSESDHHSPPDQSSKLKLRASLFCPIRSLPFERGELSQPLASKSERGQGGMAAAVSFSRVRALPTWSSSVSGDDHHSYSSVLAMSVSARPRSGARPLRSPARMMGNVNEGKGLFAPLVVVVRNIVGRKRFNQLRGKAIALHSQVINEFCKAIGADNKQRQGLIRLAKKNGEKLGFLA